MAFITDKIWDKVGQQLFYRSQKDEQPAAETFIIQKIAGYFVRFGDEPTVPQIQDRSKAQNQVPAKVNNTEADEQHEKPAASPVRSAGNDKPVGQKPAATAARTGEFFPGPWPRSAMQTNLKCRQQLPDLQTNRQSPAQQSSRIFQLKNRPKKANPGAASIICTSPNTRRLSLFVT